MGGMCDGVSRPCQCTANALPMLDLWNQSLKYIQNRRTKDVNDKWAGCVMVFPAHPTAMPMLDLWNQSVQCI